MNYEQTVDIESIVDSDGITDAQRLWLECLIGCEVNAKAVFHGSTNTGNVWTAKKQHLLLFVTHDHSGYWEKYTLYTDGIRGHHANGHVEN